MPEYVYECPVHGEFTRQYPMGAARPDVLCPICKRRSRRVYKAVPVQYHSPGFSQSLPDRPDERLDREIRHSMDFDPTTGLSWEETDKRQARRMAEGQVPKKTIRLPKPGETDSVRMG
jgi:predicted nucleic acid-binding Zn ribbon protein